MPRLRSRSWPAKNSPALCLCYLKLINCQICSPTFRCKAMCSLVFSAGTCMKWFRCSSVTRSPISRIWCSAKMMKMWKIWSILYSPNRCFNSRVRPATLDVSLSGQISINILLANRSPSSSTSSKRLRRSSKTAFANDRNNEFIFDEEHLTELLTRLKQQPGHTSVPMTADDESNLFDTLISKNLIAGLFASMLLGFTRRTLFVLRWSDSRAIRYNLRN